MIVGLLAFLLWWVSQTVRSTEISYQIQDFEERIREEKKRRSELEIQKNGVLSLAMVENIARQKLGLVVPKESDLVIVEVKK